MERMYVQRTFVEGNLTTQDGDLFITTGDYVEVNLLTQAGDILLTQNGDLLSGIIFDDTSFDFIMYQESARDERFVNYVDQQRQTAISINKKTYQPTQSEKMYG